MSTPPRVSSDAAAPTAPDTLRAGDELAVVRAGAWRLLVPLRQVERVLAAAMPAARPGARAAAPVVAVAGALLPVVFAAALVGAEELALGAGQQMVVLAGAAGRALLWVDAVEDVLEHVSAPAPAGASPGALVAGWSRPERPLAVLDVPGILALLAAPEPSTTP